MSIAVPLVGVSPPDLPLGALSFVNVRARDQCQRVLAQLFDATAMQEQKNVQIMLHLNTRNGATLLEMVANVVHSDSQLLVVLTGRQLDSGLAGLLQSTGSEEESDGNLGCKSSSSVRLDGETADDVSSISCISLPSGLVGGALSLEGGMALAPTTCHPPHADACDPVLRLTNDAADDTKSQAVTYEGCASYTSLRLDGETDDMGSISCMTLPSVVSLFGGALSLEGGMAFAPTTCHPPHADACDPDLRLTNDAADDTKAQAVAYAVELTAQQKLGVRMHEGSSCGSLTSTAQRVSGGSGYSACSSASDSHARDNNSSVNCCRFEEGSGATGTCREEGAAACVTAVGSEGGVFHSQRTEKWRMLDNLVRARVRGRAL